VMDAVLDGGSSSSSSTRRTNSKRSVRNLGDNTTISNLVINTDLHLPITRFLSWHEACSLWSVVHTSSGTGSVREWRLLVDSLVCDRGHDDSFLADLSILKGVDRYKPLAEAYKELYPEKVAYVFANVYSADRILDSVFAADDASLLQLVLKRQQDLLRPLRVDMCKMKAAITHRAKRALDILLAASRQGSDNGLHIPGVVFECPRWQPAATEEPQSEPVDFERFPMCLVWWAADVGTAEICELILCHLLLEYGAGIAEQLRLWAACCGVACGNNTMITSAADAIASGHVARVSFSGVLSSGQFVEFEDAPLPFVAACCGHEMILKSLVTKGANLQMCTRRGLTVWNAVDRHKTGDRQESLLETLRTVDPHGLAKGPEIGKCNGTYTSETECGSLHDPVRAAVEAANISALRYLLQRGARLEGSDIMAAVRSGDLDMLSFVQAECKKVAGTHSEYRKMMKATASQIRIQTRARHSMPVLRSQSSSSAADSVQHSNARSQASLPSATSVLRGSSRPSTPGATTSVGGMSASRPTSSSSRTGLRPSSGQRATSVGGMSASRPTSSSSRTGLRPSSGQRGGGGGVLRQAANSILHGRH
jgi:hypothetical protein